MTKEYTIYFLMSGESIVYIGMTGNLIMRLYQHRVDKKFDRVVVFNVFGKSKARKVENKMIMNYMPEYNYIPSWLRNSASRPATIEYFERDPKVSDSFIQID